MNRLIRSFQIGIVFSALIAACAISVATARAQFGTTRPICNAAGTGTPCPTASASPSPGFVTGLSFKAPGSNPTVTIPSGGATPVAIGDCAVLVADSGGSTGILTPASAADVNWGKTSAIVTTWFSGTYMTTMQRAVSAQDLSAGHFTLTGGTANLRICVGFYRHMSCGLLDGFSTQGIGTNTSPLSGSATSTVNGDIDIVGTEVDGPSITTGGYTPATGYTNDVVGTDGSVGCAIDHLVQPTAGTTSPASASWASITNWGSVHWFTQNIGGTK